MILFPEDLEKRYRTYSNVKTKVAREVKRGKLVKLKKGVYTDDAKAPGYVFAGSINSPSYVSFETALKIHGLIAAESNCFYSATKKKNKHKKFVNDLGEYFYQDIPEEAYAQGVYYSNESGYLILIATKEKALCDALYKAETMTSTKRLKSFLFEDLGLKEDDFWNLNLNQFLLLCPLYKSRTLFALESIVRKHLGLPEPKKPKKKAANNDSAQEAWDALAAFRNKYHDN